ncbi:hypothetical protein K491DRAFT_571115, partial [Lophiostoma macrostomum CBS 122681]
MAGNNWRKRVLDKRPKTPQPKTTFGESTSANETGNDKERLRPPSLDMLPWRKSHHDNRPPTPASSLGHSGRDDIDDSRSDAGSEVSTPRRRSGPKPRLTRLISDYLSLTSPKVEFTEFWKEGAPLVVEPPIDPLNVVVAVRSTIQSYQPISTEYNSGLLRVFEDYRKVRDEKEKLEGLLKETLDDYSLFEENWAAKEGHYQDEIRRLELIIARGTAGLSGLMRARQGTVVDRKRTRRQVISTEKAGASIEFLTREQLDDEIRSKMVFHRPSSPSGTMAALSRQFLSQDASETLVVGTPPTQHLQPTLSRRVKSELDLAKLGKMASTDSNEQSLSPAFSTSGDPLLGETELPPTTTLVPAIECEAFVALRELAALVARRRGFHVERFVANLMRLYSDGDEKDVGQADMQTYSGDRVSTPQMTDDGSPTLTPRHLLRHFRSQPFLSADENRRRHFSFEPGDDQLKALDDELKKYAMQRPRSPAGSQSTGSSGNHDLALVDPNTETSMTLSTENSKPSKIPSPLQRPSYGHVRRENSGATFQSPPSRRGQCDRRDSSSSVRT